MYSWDPLIKKAISIEELLHFALDSRNDRYPDDRGMSDK